MQVGDDAADFHAHQSVRQYGLAAQMRGDEDGAISAERSETLQHVVRDLRVQGFGRLVEQPEVRGTKQQPRERESTGLTAGQSETALAESRVQAGSGGANVVCEASGFERVPQLRIVSRGICQSQVVAQAVLKKFSALREQAGRQ